MSCCREAHTAWLEEELPLLKQKNKPITFIQQAGEVVYVPEGWYHATMSIGVTVSGSRQAARALPGTPYFLLARGEAAAERGDYAAALALFKEGLELSHDKDVDLMRKVGEMLEKQGLFSDAERYYRRAARGNPLHPAAYAELVGLLHRQGLAEAARAWLTLAEQNRVSSTVLRQYKQLLQDDGSCSWAAAKEDLLPIPTKSECVNNKYKMSFLMSEL
jgi:tetratricopeptide (TPR) repeat protein